VAALVGLGLLAGTVVAGQAGAATPTTVTRSAFYFGDASPINFWSSDLSGAQATFQQMKADGFNAVELVVPWGEFQEKQSPVTYNKAALKSLATLVSQAKQQHLQVILRLSYGVSVDPYAQDGNSDALFSNQSVYNAWLAYISKIHQTVAPYNDVKVEQLSWEDFWGPVAEAQDATTMAQRLQLASSTGYRHWLQSKYSLAQLSNTYGTHLTSWARVPTPSASTPAFSLMYQYDDWALVNRFFAPAAKRFPGLNLEARVDVDPLYNGTAVSGSYPHDDTFKLPGTNYIGMYFSPYLGDSSSDPVESASQAVSALTSTLSSMHKRSGNRPLFVFEYEIVSNSPEVAGDPAVPASQLPTFIAQSEPALQKYTLGYSLWVYRDYNMNPVYNPSFALGTRGWTMTGAASATKSSAGASSLTMTAGSGVSQSISPGLLAGAAGTPVTVSFAAAAMTSTPATVNVALGSSPIQTVPVSEQGGLQTYTVQFPASALASSGGVAIGTTAPLSLTDVQVYDFTQQGDVYSVNNQPEVAAAPLRALNQQLASAPAP
jgi:hypothetical protein